MSICTLSHRNDDGSLRHLLAHDNPENLKDMIWEVYSTVLKDEHEHGRLLFTPWIDQAPDKDQKTVQIMIIQVMINGSPRPRATIVLEEW
jgi:hypothetical protein